MEASVQDALHQQPLKIMTVMTIDDTTLPIVPLTNADEFDTDSGSDEDEPQST